MSGLFRKNAYVRPEETKEPKMKAKYRRLEWFTNRITFQYKLAGQWFWRDGYVGCNDEKNYDDVEKSVKDWLEFHGRVGMV